MPENTKTLIQGFESGKYQELLRDIYVDEEVLCYQQKRYIRAIERFEHLYGEKEVEIYSAPGRSEVGGNHTDHQYGKVLATSINLDVIAVVAKTADSKIVLESEGHGAAVVDLSVLEPRQEEEGKSEALIRGVAAGLKEEGYQIGGFEGYAASDVLSGSGMSSSAAYEVLIGNILSGLYNDMRLDPVLIAQAGQRAENRYFGKPCGLMDQMASSIGGMININFSDPQHPAVRQVEVDFQSYGYSLCIVDTKGSHADLTDEYAAVPEEMKRIAEYFHKPVLGKVGEGEFYKHILQLREYAGDRAVLRAIHFFEENKRVDEQVEALEWGDFEGFKRLIKASGDSSFKYLQNVYASRKPEEQNMSVALAVSDVALGEMGVSRVHGGGFAGTIQAFVSNRIVKDYKQTIEAVFGAGSCQILKVRKYGGMRVL